MAIVQEDTALGHFPQDGGLSRSSFGNVVAESKIAAIGSLNGGDRPPTFFTGLGAEGKFTVSAASAQDRLKVMLPRCPVLGKQKIRDGHVQQLAFAVTGDLAGSGVDLEVPALLVDGKYAVGG